MSTFVEVLIVEAVPAQAEHLKHILEQNHHQVVVAGCGKSALAAMRLQKPQIVISAVMLPEMDGYELCREIKSDQNLKDIPVILMTSLSDPAHIIRGLEVGADNFVTEPYDENLLISRIEYIVLSRKLRVTGGTQAGLEIVFQGRKYSITPDRQQIVDLLISTYETAVQKNLELMRVQGELSAINASLEDRVQERTVELKAEVAKRRAAQASLKEQQEFLEDVINANPNPVFVKDHEGRFTLVNAAMAALYGVTVAAVIGKTDKDFNGKQEEVEGILLHDKEVIETAERIHIPEEPLTDQKTGEVSWFQTVRTPLINPNGKVRCVLGVATDITKRKSAEDSLRESEQRYRQLVELSPEAIVIHCEGRFVYVNPAAAKLFGVETVAELIGRPIMDVVHPDYRAIVQARVQQNEQGEATPLRELKILRLDGNVIDVEATGISTLHRGKPAAQVIIRDITERKRSEEALKESETRYRTLVTASAQVVWHATATGEVQFGNSLWQDLTGQTDEELAGMGWLDALLPDSREQTTCLWQHAVETRDFYKDEQHVRMRDGSYRIFQVRGAPVLEEDGQVREWVGTHTDITERKRVEEALRASETTLRELVEILPAAVYVCDSSGLIESYNRKAVELWGRAPKHLDSAERFCGSYRIYKPDGTFLPHSECPMAQVLRTGIVVSNAEIIVEREDGSRRTAMVNIIPRLDAQGIMTGAINCLTDITERKLLDERVRNSEKYFRALVANASELITIFDAAGEITYESPAIERILGYLPEERIGKSIFELIHPDDLGEARRLFAKGLQHPGTAYLREYRARHRNGSWRFLEIAGVNMLDDPVIAGVIINASDITERKQSEEKLRESEAWLRSVFNASRDGILAEDCGIIVYVNQSLTKMLGYDAPEELMGRHISELLSPDDAERMTEYTIARLRGEKPPAVYEFKSKRKDGSFLECEAAVSMVTIGEKKYVITATRDITNRKLAEKALLESEERLRQSQKMEAIGTLTGGVAHDFNNLLTAILGNTQLVLKKLSPDDPFHPRLLEVENAGRRAAVLTRQLLAFSRRQILERRTINLNDTIGEITKLVQRIIGEDVEVRVKYDPNLSAVFADPAQIEQVIMNLAVNARDAMPQGGQLTIETSNVELDESYHAQYPYVPPGSYVEIRVSDNGGGMDAETQKRIFEPFFTTKQVGEGTGLGLAMVYGIIKQHDGHINVYSELGHGTLIKIFLPVDKNAIDEEEQSLQLPVIGGSETILVAEDEEPLRNLAKLILEGLGYTVLLAENGKDAVEMFRQYSEQIDMLVFDVVMPRMGGMEAYEQIRELGGEIPLLFMTGYSSETVQNRFVKQNKLMRELGTPIIQKPYSVETLGQKIREVLDGHEAL